MFTPRLTEPEILKQVLNKHGVRPQRIASQNFLVCEEAVEAAVLALDPAVPRVTELGAGLGTLTQGLVARGFQVRAIEWDRTLAGILPTMLPPKQRAQVDVVTGDLKQESWAQEPPPRRQGSAGQAWQLAGNIPYHLSGWILRRVTQLETVPARVVLLVQQEVGERLLAGPGEMSLLSLAVQLWGEGHELMRVPAHCFWPAPEVHSMLVLLVPHESTSGLAEREQVLTLARPFFLGKRKQIGGVLRRQWHLSAEAAAQLIEEAELVPTQRPQELATDDWQRLAQVVAASGAEYGG